MSRRLRSVSTLSLVAAFALSACSGGTNALTPAASNAGSVPIAALRSRATQTWYACPSASTSSGTLNCAALPLGDRKYSKSAQAGYVMLCNTPTGSPVVASAPWLNSGAATWDALAKDVVEGAVAWKGTLAQTTSSTKRTLAGNLLPIAATSGTFPIQPADPAYEYDHNPNSIAAHSFSYALPATPTAAKSPSCLTPGVIGVALDGVAIYDAFDAAGYDAVAREEQDACHGHPDGSDTYHYHGWLQACVADAGSATTNSSLLGYALDGYGIYGPWYGGKILTGANLDACHGTTSPVMWNDKLVSMYHYVSTYDFPYTLGCFKGTPLRVTQP